MQIWQTVNLHACSQCDFAIYISEKTLAHHHHTKHHDSRTTTSLDLCLKHIQVKLPPNYNPIWEKGLEFIYSNIAPDPASFRAGVCEKVSAAIQTQFDDVVMGIIYAYVQAAEEFVGTETPSWNLKASVFLWLLFHVEMLVMGPKREKSGGEKETINECAARRLNLF